MIIQPNGKVWLLSGIGLDNSYKHTYSVCFKDASTQLAFFLYKKAFEFTEFTPVRLENAITIQGTADAYYYCDYIIFQNTNFSNKYFYGFITKIEYVNISTTKIYYEIDVIQTWHKALNMNPSFVERMHAYNDSIGFNVVPENLELGEYVSNSTPGQTGRFRGWVIVVACTVTKTGVDAVGGFYGGLYSGLNYLVFETASQVQTFLTELTTQNKSDAIVSIFMYPATFIDEKGTMTPQKFVVKDSKKYTTIDGYTPKNKKLFTYPYHYLMVTNYSGTAAEYHYELFSTTDCQFTLSMEFNPNSTAILWPLNYKGVYDNVNEKITMDGFPQCPWTVDTYKAWLAQNGSTTSIHNLGTAFSGLASLFSFNIPGAVNAGFSIAESMARQNAISNLPPQAHGATGNGSLVANDFKDFWFYHMNIQYSYARRIDQYFDKFGYAQKAIMLPDVTSRESWNYIETRDVTFKNIGAPAEAQRKLEEIYNHGITFWHNYNIGDYSQNNSITGTRSEENGSQKASESI